jgi:tetratricopeptide (TPR) repeat protein
MVLKITDINDIKIKILFKNDKLAMSGRKLLKVTNIGEGELKGKSISYQSDLEFLKALLIHLNWYYKIEKALEYYDDIKCLCDCYRVSEMKSYLKEGDEFLKKEKYKEAEKYYEKALDLCGLEYKFILCENAFKKLNDLYLKQGLWDSKMEGYIKKGDEFFKKGKGKEAEECYKKVLEFYKYNPSPSKNEHLKVVVFTKLGDLYRKDPFNGRAKADKQYRKALKINPAYAEAWLGLKKTYCWSETSISNCKEIAGFLLDYYSQSLDSMKNPSKLTKLCQLIIKLAKYKGGASGGIDINIEETLLRNCMLNGYIMSYSQNKTNKNKAKITKKDLMWIEIKSSDVKKEAIRNVILAFTRIRFGKNNAKLTSDKHAKIYKNLYDEDYLKLCIAFPENKKVRAINFKYNKRNLHVKILFKNKKLAIKGQNLLKDVSLYYVPGKLKGKSISYEYNKSLRLTKFLKALKRNYNIEPLCDYPENFHDTESILKFNK